MSELAVQGTSPEAVCYAVRRQTSGDVAVRDAITVTALCWIEKELSPQALSATYAVPSCKVPEKHRRELRKQCCRYVRANMADHPGVASVAGIIVAIKVIFLIAQIVRLLIDWRLSQEGDAYFGVEASQARAMREQ